MPTATTNRTFPVPSLFNPAVVGDLRMVKYQEVFTAARDFAKKNSVRPAASDKRRVCLMPIDDQITFCFPNAELPVIGALDDINRTCEFIYKNLESITEIDPTFDTHVAIQIFHSLFWVDENGNNPNPATLISADDVEKGVWTVNPAIAYTINGGNYNALRKHALHYTKELARKGRGVLIVWPYHSMLGGVGHALVPNLEEAIFFHTVARGTQMSPQIKGGHPLTENYSILGPEVTTDDTGRSFGAQRNVKFIEKLLKFDYTIILGQAKSHCVAWSIDDLLTEINAKDPALARKVYLVEDCTSPVKVPDGKGGWILDFTQQGNEAFEKFKNAGMHVVQSTTPIKDWPDMVLE